MKNDLTIITTLVKSDSIHRNIQIERFIKYHLRFKCQIIIVCPDNLKTIKCNNDNVSIIYCKSSDDLVYKLQLAFKSVITKYISWVADDDFLGLDFAKRSIDLMNIDDKIAACDGMMFFKEECSLKRKDILYSYRSYKANLTKPKDLFISENFRFFADYYHPGAIHCIIRTNIFSSILEFISKYDIPANFGDRIWIVIILSYGDIKFIDSISNIRSYGTRIMHHNPKLFNKFKIHPGEIVLHEDIMNGILKLFEKENNFFNFRIKAGMMYFFIISSKSLTHYKKETYLEKLNSKMQYIFAYLEPFRLSIFNRQIKEDIRLVEKYMKEYPLNGGKDN